MLEAIPAAPRMHELALQRGKVKLDPKTQHTYKPFLMGKTRDDKQFDVIFKTDLIEPDPYPQVAFPGWHCDWTKDGVLRAWTRGPIRWRLGFE